MGKCVTAEILALDDFLPPDADVAVLHLDVEEFEEFALLGAAKTIERTHPILILETVPDQNSRAAHLLAAVGYRAIEMVSGNTVLVADVLPAVSENSVAL